MLFIPTVEKRGKTAAVLLDETHAFAEGIDYDTAREIANALSDRFEIYAIKDKPGFIVMVYANEECIETVKVESWSDALDAVAQRSTDLAPEDSPEDAEGAEDSHSRVQEPSGTFVDGTTPRMHYSPVDSLRYLHHGNPLDVALDMLAEHPEIDEFGDLRAVIENTQALIRDEYMHHRGTNEDPATYSNGMPVSTVVPHIACDGTMTFVSPAQHINHPGDGFRLLTRSADADRYFDGLEDGYVA
ncbi:hypothetical protein SAMN04488531_0508 [Corynebacterium coyleae]|uniref:Uncharacterized protein n=1 Tax=Corynebacterium coyleae TaxID=53374 RepID=A0ABX8KYQ4_9CORY|nr:hypothetical protein [Corynebacterium coyleae]QXB18943.1 hypothetical protein I6L55_02225 [Corynebacterium coyleae]WJY80507.1 hypothetical protein CCOY_09625 [Corynebacterium coyleae]SEB44324.1 hypothetical protein SAMN04488531_0508 [Corynebacterium coyleae]